MNKPGVILSLIILSISFLSFRWPLDNGKVTSTFGESRGDHFHDGVDMISGIRKVFPPQQGKLLYAWNHALFPFDPYTGSGNYKILSHSDGTASLYLHLEDSEDVSAEYGEKDSIGIFGNTGRSYGTHIHFTLIDLKKMDSINPYTVLPKLIDLKAPLIGPYAVRIGEKLVLLRNKSKIRLTQDYPLLVKIYDQIAGGERLGIYSLRVVFNDDEVLDVAYDKINTGKNGLTISGKNFDNLYDGDGFYKVNGVKYRSGLNTVIVTASDFQGNQTKDIFTIDITLDR
jgi:Peptidase family M23